MVARIAHDLEWDIPVRWLYDRGRNQCLFDPAKSPVALISKDKQGILGEELSKRFSNLGEILDKAAIKPRMTKETPHPFYRSRKG